MRVILSDVDDNPENMVADGILMLRSIQSVLRELEKHRCGNNRYSVAWESGEVFTVSATQTGWKATHD